MYEREGTEIKRTRNVVSDSRSETKSNSWVLTALNKYAVRVSSSGNADWNKVAKHTHVILGLGHVT